MRKSIIPAGIAGRLGSAKVYKLRQGTGSAGARSKFGRFNKRSGRAVVAVASASICMLFVAAFSATNFFGGRVGAASPPANPIGIVSADASEQAKVLSLMHVTSQQTINGYNYQIGTIDGHPVVDTASGEMTDTTLLATWTLDQSFHPRATLFVGTSGANIAALHVGDVVLGGFVTDKTQIHYHLQSEFAGAPSTFQTAYSGIELHTGTGTLTAGDIINRQVTGGIFVNALASTKQLAEIAANTPTGSWTNTVADATGDSTKTGTIHNKVIIGVAGQGNVWTEPLEDIAAQNALFPSDAEANEDPGFVWANQEAGVPSLDIRDISDTPWEPNAYDGSLASQRGAAVAQYVVDNLGPNVNTDPITMSDLSNMSAAHQAGYLVADKAFYDMTPVNRIDATINGKSTTLTGASLANIESQYTYGQDGL